MRWRAYAVLALLAALLTAYAGPAEAGLIGRAATAAPAAPSSRLFAFADPRIGESSGLVDLGRWMVTANDSGNPADVFVVDPRSGRTVGITHLRTPTTDVEALAPAGPGHVWVADIGDNDHRRRAVALYLAPVGVGRRVAAPKPVRLVYPDGRHDAESAFTDGAGHVYLISKSLRGGTVYRVPPRWRSTGVNRLVAVGHVADLATDAAMMRDGRHLLVRSYGLASVYTFPQLRLVARFALPHERQGEGISVGPQGRIRLSSEGRRSAVLQIALPAAQSAVVHPAAATPSPSPSPSPSTSPSVSPPTASSTVTPAASSTGSPSRRTPHASGAVRRTVPDTVAGISRHWLYWSIPVVLLLGAAGIGLGLRRRRE